MTGQKIIGPGEPGFYGRPSPVHLADFVDREFPDPDFLFPWLPIGSAAMVYGDRGLGKSMFSMSLAAHLAAGKQFLNWPCKRSASVLYVDGEMNPNEIQERLQMMSGMFSKEEWEAVLHGIKLESSIARENGLPHLGDPAMLGWWSELADVANAEVIILDSLMVLAPTTVEADVGNWNHIASWITAQRRAGRTVVVAHHTNQRGGQYGTKMREMIFHYIIKLSRAKGYDASKPCHFDLTFEKNRGGYGDEFMDIHAEIAADDDGKPCWRHEGDKKTEVLRLLREGNSVRKVEELTGVPKSTISAWRQGQKK